MQIIDQLKPLAVKISTLVPDPANARKHDTRNLDAIKGSLTQFGQRKPIVVKRQGMVVIAGNGTLEAAKSMGWEEIAAVIVDDDITTATAYGIADNRSAELASWDTMTLGTLLGGLEDTAINMESLGFTDSEIRNLIGELEPTMQNDETSAAIKDKCPTCGREN